MAQIQSAASSFWAPINEKLEQRHKDAHDLQKQQRESYQQIVQDPDTSDEVKNWAWGEWQKTLHPDARKKFAPIQPIVQKILGAFGGNQKRQAAAGQTGPSYSPDDPGAPGATASAPATRNGSPVSAPNGPAFDTAAANKRALDFMRQKSDIEQARQVAVQQAKPQPGTLGKATEYRHATDPNAPPITVQQHNRTGQFFDLQGKPAEVPEGYLPYKAPTPGTRRQFRYTVNGEDGKPKEVTVFQDTKTQQMYDIHGKPFQLPEDAQPVDEEAKLAKLRGSYYGTGEVNAQKRFYASQLKEQNPNLSDSEVEDMSEQMATAWVHDVSKRRAEQIGAGRSTERPMVVGGEVRAVPFGSQPVPRPMQEPPTPAPAPTAGGTSPVAPPAVASPKPAPATTARPPSAAAPSSVAPPVVAGGPGRLVGLPPAQYRAMLNDIRAVRAGASQLFGDPNVPDIQGLVGYGDLADNKDSRERLGKALRLTFDGLSQSSSGGGAGADAKGVSLNVGGIGTWVGNALGVPAAVANQQAKMMQDAVAALTPREREAYNATIASAEGIIGLRRITGAGPSQQSVRAIQEAMPVIGVNTTDRKQFDDKSRRLAVEFSAGTRGIPRTGFDAETNKQLDDINGLPERLAKGGPAKAPGPPTVKSKADYDKLPSGTVYLEDGKKFKKP